MRHIARRTAALAAALLGLAGTTAATAASIGTIFGTPHIGGKVTNGDLDEVRKDLAGHFDKPLSLRIDPASHPLEVMRIGLWLRGQQPDIKLRDTCIGACAWFMLTSGRSLQVTRDTVIAFGIYPELWATIGAQLDRGDLSIDDERSRASIQSFKDRIPAYVWEGSAAFRQARLTQSNVPAWIQDFIEASTSLTVTQLARDDRRFDFRVALSAQRCVWWVPDAEGLRQLGLTVPAYVPPDATRAAKALGVSAKVVYIGPALRELPDAAAAPLCEGDPDLQLKMP